LGGGGGGGVMQVLRNAIKTLFKRKKRVKKREKLIERYVTGKGGQVICYEALHMVGGLKRVIFSVT